MPEVLEALKLAFDAPARSLTARKPGLLFDRLGKEQ
jgi:hypothetical protein